MAEHNDTGKWGEEEACNLLIEKGYAIREKMMRMVRSANAYMQHYDLPHEVQFDVIAITGNKDNYEIEHIPDAFYPPLKSYR